MLNLSLNLPIGRFYAQLKRRAKAIFTHKHLKRILGSNLAFILIASSIIPVSANASAGTNQPQQETVITVPQQTINTQVSIHYPLTTTDVSQGFGFFHPGVDFQSEIGANVTPMMAGKVTQAGWDITGYGNKIVVSHEGNIETLYAHLSKIDVKVGDEVETSTKIGEVGVTGHSTGPHLHFEVRKNGIPVNPFSVLPKLN